MKLNQFKFERGELRIADNYLWLEDGFQTSLTISLEELAAIAEHFQLASDKIQEYQYEDFQAGNFTIFIEPDEDEPEECNIMIDYGGGGFRTIFHTQTCRLAELAEFFKRGYLERIDRDL